MADIEHLDISDREQVAAWRGELAMAMPEILDEVGLPDQAQLLRNGRFDDFVGWFRGAVAVGNHGVADGGLGLTSEAGRRFNPHAKRHGMFAPNLKLWQPGDELPEGAHVGDIANYQVAPDYDSLPSEVFVSGNYVAVAGATVSGLASRVETGMGVLARMEQNEGDKPLQMVVYTGMRRVKGRNDPAGGIDEGANGLYRKFLPEGMDPETPVQVAFPTETDAAIAIVKSHTVSFYEVNQVPDPEAGSKLPERQNPLLAQPSREWIARTCRARLNEQNGGKLVEVTFMNGEPIAPPAGSMNRNKKEPAPFATETFREWVQLTEGHPGKKVVFSISYAHLLRIAAELKKAGDTLGVDPSTVPAIGKAMLVGSMPQQAVWDRVDPRSGQHHGPTTSFKELFPALKALNQLLDLEDNDFSV